MAVKRTIEEKLGKPLRDIHADAIRVATMEPNLIREAIEHPSESTRKRPC